MIKKQVSSFQYILSSEEANIFKSALEYCKHRQIKHDACKHLTRESVADLLKQLQEFLK